MNLKYEDLSDLFPEVSKTSIQKLNERLNDKLRRAGFLEECKEHSIKFQKLATISGNQFESRQWGYKCTECGVRLHPVEFVAYDPEKHSGIYLEKIPIRPVKSALELSKELLS
jgi:hypothetical protein